LLKDSNGDVGVPTLGMPERATDALLKRLANLLPAHARKSRAE
jgi:hypothetical protein